MVMKKFLNEPQNITTELLEGLALAYPSKVKLVGDKIIVRANSKPKNQVAVITLGGTGHEPALSGYVGDGMLDAAVAGDVFAAPGAPKVLEALRLFADHAGILLVILNHAGDVMNGNMGLQMAQREGIHVQSILTCDDIAPGVNVPLEERRGLGGCVPLIKIVGAAADAGKSLDEILEIAEKFNRRMVTLAVTMKTATHPQSGEYISTLPDNMLEIGMGQHGEGGGTGPQPIVSADEVAETMVKKLVAAANVQADEKVVLIINGSGATTLMEQFIIFRKAYRVLESMGIQVVGSRCEEILTVQESGGFQMFLGVVDDELLKYFNAASDAPYWVTR